MPLIRKPQSKLLSACSDREWHAVGKQLRSRVRAAVDVGSGSDPTVSSAIGRRASSALVSTSQKVSQQLRKMLALPAQQGRTPHALLCAEAVAQTITGLNFLYVCDKVTILG
jgi:hypothetical protein